MRVPRWVFDCPSGETAWSSVVFCNVWWLFVFLDYPDALSASVIAIQGHVQDHRSRQCLAEENRLEIVAVVAAILDATLV